MKNEKRATPAEPAAAPPPSPRTGSATASEDDTGRDDASPDSQRAPSKSNTKVPAPAADLLCLDEAQPTNVANGSAERTELPPQISFDLVSTAAADGYQQSLAATS